MSSKRPTVKKTDAKKVIAKKTVSAPAKKSTAQGECFTIMPFGGWFDDYYASVYKPAIEASGLIARRADDLYRPSAIVNDIWAYTKAAKIILADLSGKNPNVFYELGLAHALAKPAILIAESMDDVPFDLRALRVIVYDKNQPNWGGLLQSQITQSILEIMAAPMEAVLPTFLTVRQDDRPKAITEQDKAFLELKREIDLLRNEMSDLRASRRYSVDAGDLRHSRSPTTIAEIAHKYGISSERSSLTELLRKLSDDYRQAGIRQPGLLGSLPNDEPEEE